MFHCPIRLSTDSLPERAVGFQGSFRVNRQPASAGAASPRDNAITMQVVSRWIKFI